MLSRDEENQDPKTLRTPILAPTGSGGRRGLRLCCACPRLHSADVPLIARRPRPSLTEARACRFSPSAPTTAHASHFLFFSFFSPLHFVVVICTQNNCVLRPRYVKNALSHFLVLFISNLPESDRSSSRLQFRPPTQRGARRTPAQHKHLPSPERKNTKEFRFL